MGIQNGPTPTLPGGYMGTSLTGLATASSGGVSKLKKSLSLTASLLYNATALLNWLLISPGEFNKYVDLHRTLPLHFSFKMIYKN